MLKNLKKFDVNRLEILDTKGNYDKKLMPKLNNNDVKKLYESMILTRIFDRKALNLQRQGRLGTYASMEGQEATIIGSSYALEKEDWLFPCFRENGALILRGQPMHELLMYWAGDERGMNVPKNINNFPIAIPVATQILHAVGVGMAAKIKSHKTCSLVYFGDGATSEGDFHEGLNMAGVYKAPVVFICQNNQWAISVPRDKQTSSETLAQKAVAYGINGIQVDGNDIFAVYKATKDALDSARKGQGPTLIECETYRINDHTTSDDAKKYRDLKEVEEWKKKDPIVRLWNYMKKKKLWSKDYETKLISKLTKDVEDAVKKAESMPKPKPEDMFKYVYKNMTERQKKELGELNG
ncbi:MAG: pyruvate dehydrogenase (acetyl-transferring) E1 component subunit alpha [Nanoarchaeota archaeon]